MPGPEIIFDWPTGHFISDEDRTKFIAYENQATCEVCDWGIWWTGRSKPPFKCHRHRRFRTKAAELVLVPLLPRDDFETLTRRKKTQTAKELARERAKHSQRVTDVRQIAAGFRITQDWSNASQLAGIGDRGPEELAELIEAASTDPALESLRQGRQSAAGRTVATTIQLLAERLLAEIHMVPAESIPNALRALTQANQHLGGFKTDFSNVQVNFGTNRGRVVDILRTIAETPRAGEAQKLAKAGLKELRAA